MNHPQADDVFKIVKDTEYNIRIANVREVSDECRINRWESLRYSSGDIAVTLSSKFIPDAAAETITLRLTTTYCYLRAMLRHTLLRYCIEMVFDISPNTHATNGNRPADHQVELSPRLMLLLYGPAIGALRGMLALRTANIFLKNYPLPLINISALVNAHVNGHTVPADIVPISDFRYS